MSKAWEKHGCGSLGEVEGGRGVGMCVRPEEVCVPGVFAMQPGARSSGLLGTPVCVQLDLQDVFIREAIPLLHNTHTGAHGL